MKTLRHLIYRIFHFSTCLGIFGDLNPRQSETTDGVDTDEQDEEEGEFE